MKQEAPYGKEVTLVAPVRGVECWNFSTDTRFDFPAGTRFRIEHAYDSTHATCTLVSKDEEGRDGIMLSYEDLQGRQYKSRGYRFIIDNASLSKAAGVWMPARTQDLVGDLMRYESGEMDEPETEEFLHRLSSSGLAKKLQGHYSSRV